MSIATYARQWALMTDPDFHGRCTMALLHVASDVWNEPESTPNYERRHEFAWRVMQEPRSYLGSFLAAVCSNPTIAAAGPVDSPDSDLYFVIASRFGEVTP